MEIAMFRHLILVLGAAMVVYDAIKLKTPSFAQHDRKKETRGRP
jgi:hypothetical protein